jgi:hypothetical protein
MVSFILVTSLLFGTLSSTALAKHNTIHPVPKSTSSPSTDNNPPSTTTDNNPPSDSTTTPPDTTTKTPDTATTTPPDTTTSPSSPSTTTTTPPPSNIEVCPNTGKPAPQNGVCGTNPDGTIICSNGAILQAGQTCDSPISSCPSGQTVNNLNLCPGQPGAPTKICLPSNTIILVTQNCPSGSTTSSPSSGSSSSTTTKTKYHTIVASRTITLECIQGNVSNAIIQAVLKGAVLLNEDKVKNTTTASLTNMTLIHQLSNSTARCIPGILTHVAAPSTKTTTTSTSGLSSMFPESTTTVPKPVADEFDCSKNSKGCGGIIYCSLVTTQTSCFDESDCPNASPYCNGVTNSTIVKK